MYQIKINDGDFAVMRDKDQLTINDSVVNADVVKVGPSNYHVIHNHRSYNVEVVDFDAAEKTATIKVDNNIYPVTSKDQFDLLLEQLGLNHLKAGIVSDLKAPMPGLVLKVFVKEND